ncbi:hypothetical protein PICSAR132_01375 [Mycobacterium avium subsp. paratuberculosis]|nr:hypothetical protein PICSAR132_01375 [Mycobacterium avium subsp. paratuberculosis]CAG7065890.1 hypothetical protein PICSAR181_02386 [Mycobacterium avium subsp. paratuberculosis]CAG7148538.1 hypothetical protein PICSAR25_01094 [Mycobacterium avium subsp. paratuberculosis]CAG7215526.1 hypothetical protein PICSAR26_00678 [Mycobacterium avium subsp. paratuberculosis]CAG7241034.1 hypothetical protein PICSAR55_00559 [Mycobacterium avium subsp. paratuberculosis]
MSGEIRPGDWANVNASAIAPTSHNHRRETVDEVGFVSVGAARAAPTSPLATVSVLHPVEH